MALKTDHRWIILEASGQHVTLGRHRDPTEEEILAAENGLLAQGLSGWLAMLEGNYWIKRSKLSVMVVRPLANPVASFDSAVTAFKTARAAAVSQS